MIKAAEKNQVNSMTDLGWLSFTGEYGVKKDFKKAAKPIKIKIPPKTFI